MVSTCVDDVIKSLSSLKVPLDYKYQRACQIHDYLVDLRSIKMFLWCSVSCDYDAALRSNSASIESIWEHDGVSKDLKIKDLQELGEKIRESRRGIKKHCELLVSKSVICKPLRSHEIQQFLDAIVVNMDHLVTCIPDDILPFIPWKNEIDILQKKLLIFRNLVEFTDAQRVDFNSHIVTWAVKAAFLTLLTFQAPEDAKGRDYSKGDKEYGNKMNFLYNTFYISLQKANPCTPKFIKMCFEVIKSTKWSSSDILFFEEYVSDFVDFLLQNLMFSLEDGIAIREGLKYLITFLAGSPTNSAEDSELIFLQSQIDGVLDHASRLICLIAEAKMDFSKGKMVLAELINMIDQVRGKIDKHCLHFPLSTWSNNTWTDGLGYVKSLLVHFEDLEEAASSHPKLAPSSKHQIFKIKDKLTSLWSSLQDISEILNEHKELTEFWEEIIHVAYQAELAIKQSFFIDRPLCLSYVLRKIQYTQSKVMRVKDSQLYTNEVTPSLANASNMFAISVPPQNDEEVVGFMQEAEGLIEQLIWGAKEVDIVSIVGMGGIGKTTLAKKLYNDVSVRHCFHRRAFCTISQVYYRKNILLEILTQLIGQDVDGERMTEEDLALRLYKSLKGYRYLIVLDDIWGTSAWNDVKDSFPDDHKMSRIIFTTRVYDVAFLAKPDCTPHRLRFLTIDESWELLQRKIFDKNSCPLFLHEVGRSIAENCKGLPLAIVVIAGLLAKSERSVCWWQKIADNLTSYVSSEGCAEVLELSCKHLPDALKSCFLYLGAFPEDTNHRAGDITKLWAAEGFVSKSDRNNVHKSAKEYLNYLGDRSLLIVTERSSRGWIKRFRLHDVIRDFCISKAQEEQLLCMVNGDDGNFSKPLTGHRICIQGKWRSFLTANPRGPTVHSLLCFKNGPKINVDGCLVKSLLRNFKLIQVLDLRFVVMLHFPSEITMLVHLRYLAIVSDTSNSLPLISKLRNLETLLMDLKRWCVDFGDTIWKMERLRHLETLGSSTCCFSLGDVASKPFSQLPDLETLGRVEIRDQKEGEVLRGLPNVRKLSCMCWEFPEQLVNLSKLESLSINWYGGHFDSESSLSFPSTLRKLSLYGFRLPGTVLSAMIRNLPFLQILKLENCGIDGNLWDMEDDEFPTLKCLELNISEIEYLNATTDSFPCLEKLVLRSCNKLIEVPPCFGEISTLRTLNVSYCSEGVETSANQIERDQLDMGNESFELVIKYSNASNN